MAKYRVWAEESVMVYIDIEAVSEDEALELAEDTDGADWKVDESSAVWEIQQEAELLTEGCGRKKKKKIINQGCSSKEGCGSKRTTRNEMGRKNPKTVNVRILQGNYGYGWDDLVEYDDNPEGWRMSKDDYKSYRENEPQYRHRIINRRVPNPNYIEPEV